MADEETTLKPPLKQRIDDAAHRLLDLMEAEEDGKTLGGLFGQVVAWYKVQHPESDGDEGSRLKEMAGNVETISNRGKRGGRAGTAADTFRKRAGVQPNSTKRDGNVIRDLIKRGLPKIGPGDDGDSEDFERPGIGGHGDGGRVRPDGDGISAGNYDGPDS